jgi:hypothetical protein
MQNKYKLIVTLLTLFCLNDSISQSLVGGGFVSFNLQTDSSQISSNSGGVLLVNDKLNSCVQLQSGNSIGGFEMFSKETKFVDLCEPFEKLNKNPNLKIYPNPGFGFYTLESTDAVGFFIIDITGKIVLPYVDLNPQELNYSFDISNLAEACYMVRVKLNDGSYSNLPIIKTIK